MSVVEPLSPLAGVLVAGRFGATGEDAVGISERRYDLIQVFARAGRSGDVVAAMQTRFGVALPGPGREGRAPMLAALWIQPDAWLLVAPRGPEGELARTAKQACGDAASVVDQTHGRCVIGLSGARAAWVLGKLCRIDLHPRVFGPGQVAVTPVAGLSCIVHHRDDVPSYDLVVFATFARSFVASLLHAAEETGYRID